MNEQSERVRSALSHLDPASREVWVRAATCIKSEYPDSDGFEIWDQWGSQSDSYKASDAKAVWKSIKSAGKLTIASLFYDAKLAGWVDTGAHKKRSKAEIDADRVRAAERAVQAAIEEAALHEERAVRAQQIWDSAAPCVEHPYLDRKGVASYGLRVGPWEYVNPETNEVSIVIKQALLIPIKDSKGKLWSLQGIDPGDGSEKRFLKGAAKSGNLFPIGKRALTYKGKQVYVLGEGYATCASVHAATGHLVLVCFDTSNLLRVAEKLRASKPDAIILFAADNDTETVERAVADGLSRGCHLVEWTTYGGAPAAKMRDGQREFLLENPGVTAACKAAAAVGGLLAVPPPGDFNDLQQVEGLEAVAAQVESALYAIYPLLREQREDQQEKPKPNSSRDEPRRCQQQQENKRIQEADMTGAMIPSTLSVEEMLERCVWVATGGHVAYVTEDRSMFLTFSEFSALTASSTSEVEHEGRSTKKTYPNAILWKKDKRRKGVMSVTFHAGKPSITTNPQGVRSVNTWRPIRRWTTSFDVAPFLEHVAYLISDASEREVFLDWLAHIEQNPGELPHYGWLHIADKTGTGRNWLASLLARVFKGYVAPNVDLPALLDSAYNGELGGRVLAIVDEVQEGGSEGNYRHAERLKSMINSETRMINNKYGLKYTEMNSCRWLIFSNHQNALPIKSTDRRFRVLTHREEPRLALVYAHLYSLLQDPEFINAVGCFLQQRDISNFKPGERPPMSQAKLAAIAASKPVMTQNSEDILKYWPADVITYGNALLLLTGEGHKAEITASARRAMEEVGAVTWRKNGHSRIKMDGTPTRFWILRNHTKWLDQDTDAIRAEAKRAKASDPGCVLRVFADAVDALATRDDPPI